MSEELLDLLPELNGITLKWEVGLSDERGNSLEVYEFDTEDEALIFIDQWIEQHENEQTDDC